MPLYAREGREHQKYGDEGERLVAGCIPVRFKPGVAGPSGVEVLLITSRGGKGHVFPKVRVRREGAGRGSWQASAPLLRWWWRRRCSVRGVRRRRLPGGRGSCAQQQACWPGWLDSGGFWPAC